VGGFGLDGYEIFLEIGFLLVGEYFSDFFFVF
jgi:hypothetical protein